MRKTRVAVIGAGIGGLATAIDLARQGVEVVVLERAEAPGGKMREIAIGAARLDAGPTVFTLKRVFDGLLGDAGTSLERHVRLQPMTTLARHGWAQGGRLDLFADVERSADAIGDFAGAANAKGFLEFCARSRRIFETLDETFIQTQRPGVVGLTRQVLPKGLAALWGITPFTQMWKALGQHFPDVRLRQLFGRYATYCGSSPFQAPATLMLVAHVEQEGVWMVEGGMHQLARALASVAEAKGAVIRYGAEVQAIRSEGGRTTGVELDTGERIEADAVVANADAAALAAGHFGAAAKAAVPSMPATARSLSALTFSLVAKTKGFPLLRHSVFFSGDYPAEFRAIFQERQLPGVPTVYICAHDRADVDGTAPDGPERLLCLVNAPARGDTHPFDDEEIERCADRTFRHLASLGLEVERSPAATVTTTPTVFDRLFPATGGALYGRASHGWMASFQRPGSTTKLPGLFLAGGSTHPGPGVPMAAISGRLAANAAMAYLASIRPSRPAAIAGGTSTR
ncbi:MAG: phytoene desaturase [Geminicoccaceae bacterium]|nr:MAG: phytoene desaturase [Geminicoccaceae bacterium]